MRIVDGTDRDLTDGVAVRVAALGLDGAGRLSDKLLVGVAVRGGLLLDLALAGRVESAVDSVVVDPTPTGFAPADGLLAAISVERERSLDGWLDETRIRLRDVGEANVASGRWERRPSPWGLGRRYTDLRSARTARDRAMVPSRTDAAWTPGRLRGGRRLRRRPARARERPAAPRPDRRDRRRRVAVRRRRRAPARGRCAVPLPGRGARRRPGRPLLSDRGQSLAGSAFHSDQDRSRPT